MVRKSKHLLFGICIVLSLFLVNCEEDPPINNEPDIHFRQYKTEARLYADDGAENNTFGSSVILHDDIALVSAINLDAVYMFKKSESGWNQQMKITSENVHHGAQFGGSVSISGDYLIVGARYNNINDENYSGSAHILKFDGSEWKEEAFLTSDNPATVHGFGASVSISGNYAAVGVPGDNVNGPASGSCYIYKLEGENWIKQQILTPGDADSLDYFGSHISMYQDHMIIAADRFADPDTWVAKAYIFKLEDNSWIEHEKLTTNMFSLLYSVAINEDFAFIGSRNSCYAYHRIGTKWSVYKEVIQSDHGYNDAFGISISVSGVYLIVGAPFHSLNDNDSGAAYIYRFNGRIWEERMKLTEKAGTGKNSFGRSVFISGDQAMIGATSGDGAAQNSGIAYIYNLE